MYKLHILVKYLISRGDGTVYMSDLKSDALWACGFESHSRHFCRAECKAEFETFYCDLCAEKREIFLNSGVGYKIREHLLLLGDSLLRDSSLKNGD